MFDRVSRQINNRIDELEETLTKKIVENICEERGRISKHFHCGNGDGSGSGRSGNGAAGTDVFYDRQNKHNDLVKQEIGQLKDLLMGIQQSLANQPFSPVSLPRKESISHSQSSTLQHGNVIPQSVSPTSANNDEVDSVPRSSSFSQLTKQVESLNKNLYESPSHFPPSQQSIIQIPTNQYSPPFNTVPTLNDKPNGLTLQNGSVPLYHSQQQQQSVSNPSLNSQKSFSKEKARSFQSLDQQQNQEMFKRAESLDDVGKFPSGNIGESYFDQSTLESTRGKRRRRSRRKKSIGENQEGGLDMHIVQQNSPGIIPGVGDEVGTNV